MIETILVIITFLVLFCASYTDLKTREVPDFLNYGFIIAVLGIRAIFAVDLGWQVFWAGVIGLGVCLVLASFFYYSHQWGGGDSKLLMGMGAAIGIAYPLSNQSLELLWFFLLLLFVGALYGVVWMMVLAIRKRAMFVPLFATKVAEYKTLHWGVGGLSLLLLFAFGYLYLPYFFLGIFPLALFYLFLFVSAVEQSCFIKDIPIERVTEGDWLAKGVVIQGKTIISAKTLEREDLQKLHSLKLSGKASMVTVKEGVPFIPSFLLAYLLLMWGYSWWSTLLVGILG